MDKRELELRIRFLEQELNNTKRMNEILRKLCIQLSKKTPEEIQPHELRVH